MTPYLSFVVGGRNDDYGGNFLGRMRNFLHGLSALVETGLPVELVVVDWNPPLHHAPLADAVEWPADTDLDIRIVEVPSRIHDRLPNADRMPIFEYIAKNAGLRRARGEFVVATNPDILYGRSLLDLFAARGLRAGRFYRVDRYDVIPAIPDEDYDDQLAFCERNFTKINVWGDTLTFKQPLHRWRRSSRGVARAVRAHFEAKPENRDPADPVRRLHTNASGDFLLMHRDHWHHLRGYPELSTASHIDSYMCAIAASSGLAQEILPYRYRIYHQEHPRAVDFSNLAATTRPLTSYDEYAERTRAMLSTSQPWIVNDESWGLGTDELNETVVAAGRTRQSRQNTYSQS
jgi:hypothetical protein